VITFTSALGKRPIALLTATSTLTAAPHPRSASPRPRPASPTQPTPCRPSHSQRASTGGKFKPDLRRLVDCQYGSRVGHRCDAQDDGLPRLELDCRPGAGRTREAVEQSAPATSRSPAGSSGFAALRQLRRPAREAPAVTARGDVQADGRRDRRRSPSRIRSQESPASPAPYRPITFPAGITGGTFTLTFGDFDGGVFRSTDNGATFDKVLAGQVTDLRRRPRLREPLVRRGRQRRRVPKRRRRTELEEVRRRPSRS